MLVVERESMVKVWGQWRWMTPHCRGEEKWHTRHVLRLIGH